MRVLIIKMAASGDVVRTTTLLNILKGDIHWLTSDNNMILLNGVPRIEKCIPWSKKNMLIKLDYDFVINLEDSLDAARLLNDMKYKELFGAYLGNSNKLTYTENSKDWFDISLISNYGKRKADQLKFENRKTYQEMIFNGLGYTFNGQKYFLPKSLASDLIGDIAVAPKSGSVWPMKNWAYYDELKKILKDDGYIVNFLPMRDTLIKHIADIKNHKYLICGDSFPMHIALGTGIKCLTIFICTSPWEIYDYGVQRKIVSPYLKDYFYKRDSDFKATASISIQDVYSEVLDHFK